jgi:hypothetical protein
MIRSVLKKETLFDKDYLSAKGFILLKSLKILINEYSFYQNNPDSKKKIILKKDTFANATDEIN